MDLYLLAELKTISLKVTTVDMLKPPPDFRYVTLDYLRLPGGECAGLTHSLSVHRQILITKYLIF